MSTIYICQSNIKHLIRNLYQMVQHTFSEANLNFDGQRFWSSSSRLKPSLSFGIKPVHTLNRGSFVRSALDA